MPNQTVVGMRLTQLRMERGQTRAYVARQLKLPYATLNAYETGFRGVPDQMKVRLADYYGLTVQELFFTDDYYSKGLMENR